MAKPCLARENPQIVVYRYRCWDFYSAEEIVASQPMLGRNPATMPVLPMSTRPDVPDDLRRWYAVFTVPQHEKSVVRHLDTREIESFLPTFETTREWKNRQRMKLIQPLFPTYLFVRIEPRQRARVVQSPGVIRIIGNSQGPIELPACEVEFLRSEFCSRSMEPYRDLVLGERVRIKRGSMRGVEGTLVRKKNKLRFVLSVGLINQNAAVEVSAEELEFVSDECARAAQN
jgi:transcription antitermination factor NusG